jgi:hypothetical protein
MTSPLVATLTGWEWGVLKSKGPTYGDYSMADQAAFNQAVWQTNYVKVCDGGSRATCSSGVLRFGVAASNTWSADIAVTGEFLCSSAGLSTTDPAYGIVKECQCKIDSCVTIRR